MRFILAALFCLLTFSSFAQIHKFKAKKYMLIQRDTAGDFLSASQWDSVNALVVVNLTNNKLQIYLSSELDFDIVKYTTNYKDERGDEWFKMKAVDKDGKNCNIRMLYFKETTPTLLYAARVYIDYLDYTFSYMLDKD